jgi:hypothetical protein
MSALVVVHAVTDNSPLGEPQPPFGEDFHWHAVRLGRDQTMWRRLACVEEGAAEDPAPGGRAAEQAPRRGQPP